MRDPCAMLPGQGHRIGAGKHGVSRVEQQLHRWSGRRHETVDVGAGLHDRAHVVMVGERDAFPGNGVGQFGQLRCERVPLGIRNDRTVR